MTNILGYIQRSSILLTSITFSPGNLRVILSTYGFSALVGSEAYRYVSLGRRCSAELTHVDAECGRDDKWGLSAYLSDSGYE